MNKQVATYLLGVNRMEAASLLCAIVVPLLIETLRDRKKELSFKEWSLLLAMLAAVTVVIFRLA